MSGKPAARQTDSTLKGGPIVQGSATVLIGSAGGIACSVCPGGMAVGSPVNPALGAKVLVGADDLDFGLPGPLPLVWQRQYSSYVNAIHGAPCGLLGYGWKLPVEIGVRRDAERTLFFDTAGRTVTYDERLAPGASLYSASEDLWLLRGGGDARGAAAGADALSSRTPRELQPWTWQARWSHVPARAMADPHCVIAASGSSPLVWLLWPDATGLCRLGAVVDRFGRHQQYRYDAQGRLATLTDGSGRRYALHYSSETKQPGSTGTSGDTGSGVHPLLGPDSGQRLVGVDCIHNPLDPASAFGRYRPVPLVRYRYDAAGNLAEVLGRDGQRTRTFGYDRLHRMVQHRVRSGPVHRYVYEDDTPQSRRAGTVARPGARVVEQHNEQGLSYFFAYVDPPAAQAGPVPAGTATGVPAAPPAPALSEVQVRDSLDRLTHYHFEGAGADKRLVRLVLPDGEEQRYRYDGAGRRVAHTDPLGRTTWWRHDGAGRLLGTQHPDGGSTRQRWGAAGSAEDGLLLESTTAAGLATRYGYDAWGRLVSVAVGAGDATDAGVLTTRFEYATFAADAAAAATAEPHTVAWCDQPVAVIDPQGGRTSLAYNACGQLRLHTDCSGRAHAWHHGAWGELLEESDALGQRTHYGYDAAGRLASVQHPGGARVHYRWGADGTLQSASHDGLALQDGAASASGTAAAEAESSSTVAYTYDLWGRIVAQTQAGEGLAMRYDIAGRLVELVNENRDSTRFVHDLQDRLVQEIGFDGRSQFYRYDAAGQLVHKTDAHSRGHQAPGASQTLDDVLRSRFHYDDAGRLVARVLLQLPAGASDDALLQVQHFGYGRGDAVATARSWEGRMVRASASADGRAGPRHSDACDAWLALDTAALLALLDRAGDPALAQQAAALQWHRLQTDTRVVLARDTLGRAIGETQTVYRRRPAAEPSALLPASASPHARAAAVSGEPAVAFEHTIAHAVGPLGQRISSRLQGIGELQWLSYGSGHVHGLLLDRRPVLDIERDALHREVGRTLRLEGAAPLVQTLRLDPMGRLLQQDWQGLPRSAAEGDAPLPGARALGTLALRRHRYDALGQLVGVQTPTDATRYHYDARQRLVGAVHADAQATHPHRWRIDAAGNRLPEVHAQTARTAGTHTAVAAAAWAEQVQQNLHDADFNLLQHGTGTGSSTRAPGDAVTHWPGNRIGWSSDSQDADADTVAARCTVYRYDAFGNRRETRDPDGRTLRFGYDGLHQLVEVRLRQKDGAGFKTIARYRYDAFGRRVAKTLVGAGTDNIDQDATTYYGWDADRLVHTEDAQGIRHTVYQPDGFVPWLQLQRGTAAPDAVGTLLAMGDAEGDEDDQDGEKNMGASAMFAELPREQRETMQKTLHLLMDDSAAGTRTRARLQRQMPEAHGQQMVENLRLIRTAQAAAAQANLLVVRHYVCDHLGTPIGLIDADGPHAGKVSWAATYDAWGQVQQVFNPHGIDQPIRLQGQQFDAETGLHYNRFRFYDPGIGQYVTQDPIGLNGGPNMVQYPINPMQWTDPLGLDVYLCKQPAFGIKNGPVDHHWLKTDTQEAGMGGTRGNIPGNDSGDLPGDPVQVTNHKGRSKEDGATCSKIDGVDEKKVNEALKIGRPLGRWGPTNQCQSFARETLLDAGWKEPRPKVIYNPLPPFGF